MQQSEHTESPSHPQETEAEKRPWSDPSPDLRTCIHDFLSDKNNRPEGLRGRSPKRPASLDGFRIVGDWDLNGRPDSKRSPGCALADSHLGHGPPLHGSIIWFPDGYIRLIGAVCAKMHFGEETWTAERERFTSAKRREQNICVLTAAKSLLPDVLVEIAETRFETYLTQFDLVVARLKTATPEVWAAIQTAAANGGRLQSHEKRSPQSSELSHFRKAGGKGMQGGDGRTFWLRGLDAVATRFQKHAGDASAVSVVADFDRPGKLLAHARKELMAAGSLLERNIAALDDAYLKAAITMIRGATNDIEAARKRLISLKEMMSLSNLEAVVAYLTSEKKRGVYSVINERNGIGLAWYEHDDSPVMSVLLHLPYTVLEIPSVQKLKLALKI